MDKDFMQYVYTRIRKALSENIEYIKLEEKCSEVFKAGDYKLYSELENELQCIVEVSCYMRGFHDAIGLFKGGKNE